MGRALNQALQYRNDSRYDFHAEITREKDEEVMELGETLVGVLREKEGKGNVS